MRRILHIVAVERREIVDRHAADGRGDAAREAARVEVGDGARAAAAAADALPEPLAADAEGRHDPDSCYRDPRSTRVTHARNLYYLSDCSNVLLSGPEALAFVGSLALTAWWYSVWLGQLAAFAGWRPVLFDTLLFSGFALHHSILARPSIKAAMARVFPERLLRSIYVWLASLLLTLVCLLWRRVGGEVFHDTGAVRHPPHRRPDRPGWR